MIEEYKTLFENKLPPKSEVINRNKTISKIYAELYLQRPDVFKWAGMAAFASNHVGLGLMPYHLKGFQLLDLNESYDKKGLINDFNLLRHINNSIYDDIAWTHQAYLDGGITLLNKVLKNHSHYQDMLTAWRILDNAFNNSELDYESRSLKIWAANLLLLKHEQKIVVQPLFDKFGTLFKQIITLCASLDFNPNHFKTGIKYHSSFLLYSYTRQFWLLKESYFLPDLTKFNQRWTWLENKVIINWIENEKYDKNLKNKLKAICTGAI